MNFRKMFVAAATMSLVLAGCGNSGADWSGDQKALMREHLYGQVLPYFSKGGEKTVEWLDSSESICVSSAQTVSAEILQDYFSVYADDGWEVLTISEANVYGCEKEVTFEGDKRFIRVEMWLVNPEDGTTVVATDGDLTLVAFDPYYYEYPYLDVDTLINDTYGETSVSTPAPNAQRFEFIEPEYGIEFGFYCYEVTTDVYDTWLADLSTDSFHVFDESVTDIDNYRIANSPDEVFGLAFYHYESDDVLEIWFTGTYAETWSDATTLLTGISNRYATVGATTFAIPEVDTYLYTVYETRYMNEFYVEAEWYTMIYAEIVAWNVDDDDWSAYMTALNTAGWDFEEDPEYIYATKTIGDDVRELEINYYSGECIEIFVYFVPASE